MNKLKLLLVLLAFLFVACTPLTKDSAWVETTGTITESAQMPDGSYAYTLSYFVSRSTARNADNQLIQGYLPQYILV